MSKLVLIESVLLPVYAVCPIEYGDYSSHDLSAEDITNIKAFVDKYPACTFNYSDCDPFMVIQPAFGLACNCIDVEVWQSQVEVIKEYNYLESLGAEVLLKQATKSSVAPTLDICEGVLYCYSDYKLAPGTWQSQVAPGELLDYCHITLNRILIAVSKTGQKYRVELDELIAVDWVVS